MSDPKPSSPWENDAEALCGKSHVYPEDLPRMKRLVADALARAYEHGYAQGRLRELEKRAY